MSVSFNAKAVRSAVDQSTSGQDVAHLSNLDSWIFWIIKFRIVNDKFEGHIFVREFFIERKRFISKTGECHSNTMEDFSWQSWQWYG